MVHIALISFQLYFTGKASSLYFITLTVARVQSDEANAPLASLQVLMTCSYSPANASQNSLSPQSILKHASNFQDHVKSIKRNVEVVFNFFLRFRSLSLARLMLC